MTRYLIGSYLFTPIALAPFTMGASLVLYAFPLMALSKLGSERWLEFLFAGLLPFLPGLLWWFVVEFIRQGRRLNVYRS
jgi:hypothetical protein